MELVDFSLSKKNEDFIFWLLFGFIGGKFEFMLFNNIWSTNAAVYWRTLPFYLFVFSVIYFLILPPPPLFVLYPLIARVAQLRLTGHNRSTSKINKAYYDTKLGKTCLQGMWYKDCNIGIKDNYQISSIDKNQACKFRKDISIVIILD